MGNDTESNIAKGLISLGVKEKPTFDFLIEQLKNLPRNQKLKEKQLKDAKALLNEIQNDWEDDMSFEQNIPLLTQNNMLICASDLYTNDLPAYKKAQDKNENLNFCQTQFDSLAKKLDVLSISENYSSEIYEYEKCEASHKAANILETDFFKEGILRLLYHEGKIKEDEINDSILYEVLPSKIIFVEKLIIEYSIKDNFLYRSDETTYEKDGELYILEQEDEDDMIETISKYICDTKDLSRDSYGWIERILRNTMNKEEIQSFFDKKKVKELPQKFDIDEEPSIYDDYSKSILDDKTVDTQSISQENSYQDTNFESKGEITPPIQPKTSFSDVDTEKSITKENAKKEIEPPIKPKSSSINKDYNKYDKTFKPTNKKENINPPIQSKNSTDTKRKKDANEIVSSNDFKPVYVAKDKKNNKSINTQGKDNAKIIGKKGENYIFTHKETLLIDDSNDFYQTPPNNKGYDIEEKNRHGGIVRYIEVKTLTGKWKEGGVSITESQLKFAQRERDKWWLFVVEGINTDSPKVYQFKNPVIEANRFVFDSSWKQLSYNNGKIDENDPNIGDKYEVEINGEKKIVEILNIQGKGALLKLKVILENGKTTSLRFKKTWKKINGRNNTKINRYSNI